MVGLLLAGMNVLRSSWVPYVLTGAIAGGILLYNWGYLKGAHENALKNLKIESGAKTAEIKRNQKIATADLENVVVTARRRAKIVQTIKYIKLPADTANCSTTEWLHAYNSAVRATNAAAGFSDGNVNTSD